MKLIGRTPIAPLPFYTGKIAGFTVDLFFIFQLIGLNIVSPYSTNINKSIAIVLYSFGAIIGIISVINLGKSTRVGLPEEDTVFKTKGLYSISRNPIYLGLHLMTLAMIIYTLNPIAFMLGMYSFIIYHFIIQAEESYLSEKFGEKYTRYKANIRRYV